MKRVIEFSLLLMVVLVSLFIQACSEEKNDKEFKITTLKSYESWDSENKPSNFGGNDLFLSELNNFHYSFGFLRKMPWSDAHWDAKNKGVARRWLDESGSFYSFDAQVNSAKELTNSTSESIVISPAEKYDFITNDESYGLTKVEWQRSTYESLRKNNMSIANTHGGWAIASQLEEYPKNSVLVKNAQGRQMIFTEGDIRALLARVYDETTNRNNSNYIGTKCTNRIIVRDEKGRVVDGVFSDGFRKNKSYIFIVRNYWKKYRTIFFKDSPKSTQIKVLSAHRVDPHDSNVHYVSVYNSIEDHRQGKVAGIRRFTYLKNCRDINPGALHVALVNNYIKKKRGFVVDITYKNKLWSKPLYGFRTNIISVYDVGPDDEFQEFRSRETTQIVKVETRLCYTGNNTPKMSYLGTEGEVSNYMISYTLEIDKNGKVIGGEWDSKYPENTVDFIWLRDEDVPDTETIKYSVVKKILNCSQEESDSVVTLKDRDLDVVTCDI